MSELEFLRGFDKHRKQTQTIDMLLNQTYDAFFNYFCREFRKFKREVHPGSCQKYELCVAIIRRDQMTVRFGEVWREKINGQFIGFQNLKTIYLL